MKLPLKKIRLDGGTQTRARIQENIIEEYAEEMKAGAPFPPLIVFHDGRDHWLADGFHRWGAAMKLKLDSVECEIRQGTLSDAQWFSFSANKTNGMRRTNDDKVRAVKTAMKHSPGRPLREIARHVGVSHEMVRQHREELVNKGEIPADAHLSTVDKDAPQSTPVPGETARVVTRKGKTYTMRTGKIGLAPKPKKVARVSPNAFKPVRKGDEMVPMLAISLPLNNPQMAARAMLSRYERAYLVTLVKELSTLLKEGAAQ
jgi:transposase-like protein